MATGEYMYCICQGTSWSCVKTFQVSNKKGPLVVWFIIGNWSDPGILFNWEYLQLMGNPKNQPVELERRCIVSAQVATWFVLFFFDSFALHRVHSGEDGELIFICGQGKHSTGDLPILASGPLFSREDNRIVWSSCWWSWRFISPAFFEVIDTFQWRKMKRETKRFSFGKLRFLGRGGVVFYLEGLQLSSDEHMMNYPAPQKKLRNRYRKWWALERYLRLQIWRQFGHLNFAGVVVVWEMIPKLCEKNS